MDNLIGLIITGVVVLFVLIVILSSIKIETLDTYML